MVVDFYKYTGERNKVAKSLSDPKTTKGRVATWNVHHPVIVVRGDFTGFTYCFVDSLNRYYYIDSVEYDGDKTILSLSCDVLMTFKEQILSATCEVFSTTEPNKFADDYKPVMDVRPQKHKIVFPVSPLKETGDIVLITIKGDN